MHVGECVQQCMQLVCTLFTPVSRFSLAMAMGSASSAGVTNRFLPGDELSNSSSVSK